MHFEIGISISDELNCRYGFFRGGKCIPGLEIKKIWGPVAPKIGALANENLK